MKLRRTELKGEIVNACKQLRPKLFISEDLTPTRNAILFALRQAKRQFPNKISGSSSYNGHVYVYTPPSSGSSSTSSPNRDVRTAVNSRSALEEFCSKILGVTTADLESFSWPK